MKNEMFSRTGYLILFTLKCIICVLLLHTIDGESTQHLSCIDSIDNLYNTTSSNND